jgi:ubiquinol-cytochrome c reductase iron-sulfur subunit
LATTTTAEPTRRDFLYIATGAMAAVGAAAVAWPLIDQMNPSTAVLALASIEVDLAPIQVGQAVVFTFRGHPLFVRRRTAKEIAEADAVALSDLPDPIARNLNLPDGAPATAANRIATAGGAGKAEWFVSSGVCTHLGCTPTAFEGDFGGWLCHCHGSMYDTAGRIRKGPAPQNLEIPVYTFETATKIKVG